MAIDCANIIILFQYHRKYLLLVFAMVFTKYKQYFFSYIDNRLHMVFILYKFVITNYKG